MKKKLIGILALISIFSLASCDNENEIINNNDANNVIDNSINELNNSIIINTPKIVLNDKTISWDIIENAEAYIVNVNGVDLAEQSARSYTLTDTIPGEYIIKVKALTSLDGYENSNYSESIKIIINENKLEAPKIALNDKTISWDSISNANSYVVNVNGVDLEKQSAKSYTLTDTTPGEYILKVKAISNDNLYSSSEYSESVKIIIKEESLPIVLKECSLWIVGDSTLCSFTDDYYLPRYGYGTQLYNYLDSKVTIKNLALSGRSSRSFLEESNYNTLINGMKDGDYLIIGFGHNDEKDDDKERYAAPNLDSKDIEKDSSDNYNFQYVLNKNYIEKAKEKGTTPILCTPIVRLNSSNNYNSTSGHITSNGNYVECIKDLAIDTDTTVIDLTTLTKEKYLNIGYDNAKMYHAVTSCEYSTDGKTIVPSYSTIDNTHINKYGAKEVAYLLTNTLKSSENNLKTYVKNNIVEPTIENDYNDAINLSKKPSEYSAYNWSSYAPASNYSTINKNNISYNGEIVGYGWCGTAFGSIGGLTKKWYACETKENTFKVGQSKIENNSSSGKIATSEEGYAFLFSQIDANYNFSVSATLKVVECDSVNQAGFGIMLRDDCYSPKSENVTTNNVVAGLLCSTTTELIANWSRENNALNKTNNKITGLYSVDDEAIISLTRVGQVVTCTTVYKGITYKTTYTDFDFTSIDSKYIYVGIIATRGTIVTTSNLTLTITGVSQGA